MPQEILEVFKDHSELCLCGDWRNDSPRYTQLIYLLSPRGFFAGSLCSKKVKGLKYEKVEFDRFFNKGSNYYT